MKPFWERQLSSLQVFIKPKDSFAQSTQRARREHRETPWERLGTPTFKLAYLEKRFRTEDTERTMNPRRTKVRRFYSTETCAPPSFFKNRIAPSREKRALTPRCCAWERSQSSQMCSNLSFASSVFSVRTPFFSSQETIPNLSSTFPGGLRCVLIFPLCSPCSLCEPFFSSQEPMPN